ncbi:MAG: hypothetical protein M0P70_03550 [Desulfobulbaceae bacterium]|nr:hypothetical protein [Desulfobulbaceae bacterium]
MKNSIKKLVVMLAIGLSFAAAQSVSAETVVGTITEIASEPSVVTITSEDGSSIDIYGVKVDYLCNQYNICLDEDVDVNVEYYEYVCLDDGTLKYKATSISVAEATIDLR